MLVVAMVIDDLVSVQFAVVAMATGNLIRLCVIRISVASELSFMGSMSELEVAIGSSCMWPLTQQLCDHFVVLYT